MKGYCLHIARLVLYGSMPVFLLVSCAAPSAPTGGPKDQQPPRVKTQEPAPGATGVQGKKLVITFDENIQLQNPRQSVLISPPPREFPDVQVKKNTLEIVFKDTLIANTTYSLQFGDNIKDINESNKLVNFSWVFSTGNSLDSLELTGKAVAAGIKDIPDNTWALLYANQEDSAFLTERPYYFTKVDKTGAFKLSYLKQGVYKLYLLEDKNRNYYYDLPTEKIGFFSEKIYIDSSRYIPKIILFEPVAEEQYLADYATSQQEGKWHLAFSIPLTPQQDFNIRCLNDSAIYQSKLQEDRKTIITWVKEMPAEQVSLGWEIALGDTVVDTIVIRTRPTVVKPATPTRQLGAITSAPTQQGVVKEVFQIGQGDTLLFPLTFPVVAMGAEKIILGDTAKTDEALWAAIGADSMSLQLVSSLPPGRYTLQIPPKAVVAFTGIEQDTIRNEVDIIATTSLGSLKIKLSLTTDNQCVIEILNAKQKRIYREIAPPGAAERSIELAHLVPGRYQLSVIEDQDGNGLQTKGSYASRRLPERQFFSQPIDLKAGWEQESTIVVKFEE